MEQIGTTESANTKTDESARLVASKGERGEKIKRWPAARAEEAAGSDAPSERIWINFECREWW